MSMHARFPSMDYCGTAAPDNSCAPPPDQKWAQAPGSDPHNMYPPPGPAVALTHAPAGQVTPPTTTATPLPDWAKYLIGGAVGIAVGALGYHVIAGE